MYFRPSTRYRDDRNIAIQNMPFPAAVNISRAFFPSCWPFAGIFIGNCIWCLYFLCIYLFFFAFCLQNLRLKTELLNRGCLQDFIMDEISILQYSRFENPTSGKVVYNKLILSDFLLEDQFFDKQHFNSADASSCMNCGEKSKELKHCCPCRKVRYCSLSCQRTDWTEHKVDCCV